MTCVLCLHETTTSPVAMECLRPECKATLVACAECCKERQAFFGTNWERYVQLLLEVRHVAQEHPSLPESRV